MRVYEYGSGGSTLFFAQRVREVISCEHDSAWAKQVSNALGELRCENFTLKVCEPIFDDAATEKELSDLDACVSGSPAYKGYQFQDYVHSIDQYPSEWFDIILVDGRSRPSCCKQSISKLKPEGYIVLDNAEREQYSECHALFQQQGYLKQDFYGPGPYNRYFWRTCVWQKFQ